jgi:hypothetical protein
MARIVTYAHRPKRTPRKKTQAAAIIGPAVITSASRKRLRAEPAPDSDADDDPEATARVRAFFARMVPPGWRAAAEAMTARATPMSMEQGARE